MLSYTENNETNNNSNNDSDDELFDPADIIYDDIMSSMAGMIAGMIGLQVLKNRGQFEVYKKAEKLYNTILEHCDYIMNDIVGMDLEKSVAMARAASMIIDEKMRDDNA